MVEPCSDPFRDLEYCLDTEVNDTTLDPEFEFLKTILKGSKFIPDNVFGIGFVNKESFPSMSALYLTRRTYHEIETNPHESVRFNRIRTRAKHEFPLDEHISDLNGQVIPSYKVYPRYIILRSEPLSVLILYVSRKK